MQYKRTGQQTLVGRAKESPSFTCHPGQMVDKGDSDAKMTPGDLIDFKSDVTYTPKTENLKAKVSTAKKSKAKKNDFIDFLTENDWPAGQAPFQIGDRTPQVKRKLLTVSAHLVSTETGAKIVVKGGLMSEGILISLRSFITLAKKDIFWLKMF